MNAKISQSLNEVYIIAEMSANHNQDLEKAKALVYAAKDAGADAVKLQTFTADTVTINVKNDLFKIEGGTLWDERYLYDLYDEAHLPWEWHQELFDIARDIGIDIFSTVTDKTSTDFLDALGVPAFKISSFEITDIPLIRYSAQKMKPMIISTGIATLADIELAVNACKAMGNYQIYLLKCTSEYPAPLENMNLQTIPNLAETFGVEAGLSDHTSGYLAPVVATTLGAKVIEKHFILDKNDDSLDKEFSLDPVAFKMMVQQIRDAEKLLGKVNYTLSPKSQRSKEQFARSLFVVSDIEAGEVLTEENVKSIRPNGGLAPMYLDAIIGKRATVPLKKGTPLGWEHFQ